MKNCIKCKQHELTIRILNNDRAELAWLIDNKTICKGSILAISIILNVFLAMALWGAA